MKTKSLILISVLMMPALSGCESEPPIAGTLTKSSICNTAGLLIRRNLGDNFKTIHADCDVTNTGGENVRIDSSYQTPLGLTLKYTALGRVSGDLLKLEKIKVYGADDDFIPFNEIRG